MVHADERWISVDKECTVLSVGRFPKLQVDD